MVAIGDRIEKYELTEHLGSGGFADVYRGRHVHLGSEHALKILRPEFVANDGIRARFLDEARVQAQLDHPNIVRVTDIIASPGIAGLVMELLEGQSLADAIDAGPRPDGAQLRTVFLPILDALGFAHGRGVVHRDLKPDNIYLASVRGTMMPKLLDFGIARVRGELREEGRRKSTVATSILGTPGYMSPEQLRSAASADARSDIFSLGVALLEYASGEAPFERDSEVDTIVAVMAGDVVIPESVRADAALAATIEIALKPAPEDRFADCASFAEALGRVGGASGGGGRPEAGRSAPAAAPASVRRPVEAGRPVEAAAAWEARSAPVAAPVGGGSAAPAVAAGGVRLRIEGAPATSIVIFDREVEVKMEGETLATGSLRAGVGGTASIADSDAPRTLEIWSRGSLRRFLFPPLTGVTSATLSVADVLRGRGVTLEHDRGRVPLKRIRSTLEWVGLVMMGLVVFAGFAGSC